MNCGDVINAEIGARIGDENEAKPADNIPVDTCDLAPCEGVPANDALMGERKLIGERNGEPA